MSRESVAEVVFASLMLLPFLGYYWFDGSFELVVLAYLAIIAFQLNHE